LAALQDIEGSVEDVDTRTDQLEAAVPDLDGRVTETERHVARLRTAVLEEEQPCPNCSGGHITLTGGVIDPNRLVCDQCDYEESTAIQ
jgi:ribosomal protein S27AE